MYVPKSRFRVSVKEEVKLRAGDLEADLVFRDGVLSMVSIICTPQSYEGLNVSIVLNKGFTSDAAINEFVDDVLGTLERIVTYSNDVFIKVKVLIKEVRIISY